jgi:hypothetical protein
MKQKIDMLYESIVIESDFHPVREFLFRFQELVQCSTIYHQGFYAPNLPFENGDKILIRIYWVIHVAYSNGLSNQHYEGFLWVYQIERRGFSVAFRQFHTGTAVSSLSGVEPGRPTFFYVESRHNRLQWRNLQKISPTPLFYGHVSLDG